MNNREAIRKRLAGKEQPIISVHIHPPTEEFLAGSPTIMKLLGDSLEAEKRFHKARPIEELIEDMDQSDIDVSIIFAVDASTVYEGEKVPNPYMADLVKKYPDRLIAFAGVDPHKGIEAIKELEVAVKELGLMGLKLDPTKQDFCPTDRWVYPLYEKCIELDIPITFHGGWSPGFRMRYGDPVYIDDLAHDLPDLRINIAHFAWPWDEVCVAVVWNNRNVYFDIGGWRPKYIPPRIAHFINTTIQNKVLFSADFPVIDTKVLMKEFYEMVPRPEIRKKVLCENARRFLKI